MPQIQMKVKISPIDFVDACDKAELQELKQYLAGLQDLQIKPQDEAFYIALSKIGENKALLNAEQESIIINLANLL